MPKKHEPEVIEFSGSELDDIMDGSSHPKKINDDAAKKGLVGMRGEAAAKAFGNQIDKGKSRGAADDASDVMRGFRWNRDSKNNPGPTIGENEKEFSKGGAVRGSGKATRGLRPTKYC